MIASKPHAGRPRDPRYLAARVRSLTKRYGITTRRAKARVIESVRMLASHACHPTFFVPGRVIERDPAFFRELQGHGVELGVHGYDHVDFRQLSRTDVGRQFARATAAFGAAGVRFDGFRCPYLGYTEHALEAARARAFAYSSNRAIAWRVAGAEPTSRVFLQLAANYRAEPAEQAVSTPTTTRGLVEIPVSVPDDLQLLDGLDLGTEGVVRAWTETLRRAHERGELFGPLFHPESLEVSASALDGVLHEARLLTPSVWITQLRAIAAWWREKMSFRAETAESDGRLRIHFHRSPRGTVLARNLEHDGASAPWTSVYERLQDDVVHVPRGQRPFIGLPTNVPGDVRAFLTEQGYITEVGEDASRCALVLDEPSVVGLNSAELVAHIEASASPLVRFSCWPDGARAAVYVAGDLDALSLGDYAARVLHR